MISNQYKCIFIEVPKTGSTSIRSVIGKPVKPHLDMQEIESSWIYEGENFLNKKSLRKTYDLIPKNIRQKIGQRWLKSYFKFGFVRNPWDRVVSLYLRKEGIQKSKEMTFEEFVYWIEYSSDTCKKASTHKYQIDWFKNNDGKIAVDFIGKFENLEQDFDFVARKIGVDVQLPHKNKNTKNRKHYHEYYNDETKNIIAKKFDVDIEYFGYKF